MRLNALSIELQTLFKTGKCHWWTVGKVETVRR